MKKSLLRMLLCFAVLTLTCGTLLAADASRAPMGAVTVRSTVIHPMVDSDAAYKKIYSNLGTKTDAYDDANGWLVMGPTNTLYGYSQDIAMPFTPKKNATVFQIKIALQYYGYGANAATVALYKDAAGLPGKVAAHKDIKNLPTFGTCCTLASAKFAKGVKVKKGKQYWVVGTTGSKSTDSVNVWDYLWNDATGDFAFQQQSGGWVAYNAQLCAFAVYGTIP